MKQQLNIKSNKAKFIAPLVAGVTAIASTAAIALAMPFAGAATPTDKQLSDFKAAHPDAYIMTIDTTKGEGDNFTLSDAVGCVQ